MPPERTAAVEARRAMRELMSDFLPDDFSQDVILLTSEIVTNATEVGGGCVLAAWFLPEDRALRVEVHDRSSHVPVMPEMPATTSPRQTSGRGLRIVDALASEWGIDRMDDGKSVWFEIRHFGRTSTLV